MSQNKESGFGVLKGITQQAYDLVGKDFGLSYEEFSENLKDVRNSEYLADCLSQKGVNVPNKNLFVESLVWENGGNFIPSDRSFAIEETNVSPFVPTVAESVDLIKRGKWGEFTESNREVNAAIERDRKGAEKLHAFNMKNTEGLRRQNSANEIDGLAPERAWYERLGGTLSKINRVGWAGDPSANAYAQMGLSVKEDPDAAIRAMTADYQDKARGSLRAQREMDAGEMGGWRMLKEVGRTLSDPDVYTMGMSDVANTGKLIGVVNKLGKLGGDVDRLSEAEQGLLEAYFLSEAAAANFDGGNWAGAGGTVAQAVPFVMEMALTGGIGGAVREGAKKGLQNIFSKAAAKYADNFVGKALNSRVGKASGKLGSSLAGRVAEGYARTPFQLTTYGDVMGRNLGHAGVGVSEDYKRFEYAGQGDRKGWGEAVWQGMTSKAVENFTEMSTVPLFGAVGRLAMNSPKIAGMVSKMGEKGLGKWLSETKLKIGKFMEGNPAFSKRMRETFGVSNVFEEWTEEQLATVLHSIHGEGKLSDLIDGDQQAVILLSTLGMMGAPTVVNVGSRIKGQVQVDREYKKAVDDLYNIVANPMEEMSDVRLGAAISNMEKATDIAEVYEAAAPVLRNKDLDPDKREAFSGFVDALAQKRAFEMSASDFDGWRKDGYRKAVYEVSNRDTGRVTVVRLMDGEDAYVVGGHVVVDEDGNIDSWMSDSSVYVERKDGNREQLQTAKIQSVLDDQNSDDVYNEFTRGYDDYVVRGGMEADMDAATVAEMEAQEAQTESGGVVGSNQQSGSNVVGPDVMSPSGAAVSDESPVGADGVVSTVQAQGETRQAPSVQGERDCTGEQFDLGGGYYAVVRVKNADGSHTVEVFDQGGKLMGEMPAPAGMVEREVLKREGTAEVQQESEGEMRQGVDGETVRARTETVRAPSLQDGAVDQETIGVVEYPRDKKGRVDFDQISDPVMYSSALLDEFGSDTAIDIVKGNRDDAVSERGSLDKVKNRIERARRGIELDSEIEKLDKVLEELGYSDSDRSLAHTNVSDLPMVDDIPTVEYYGLMCKSPWMTIAPV